MQRLSGEAEVAMIFEIGLGGKKTTKIAGSKVRNGSVDKGTKARVLRKDDVVFDGEFYFSCAGVVRLSVTNKCKQVLSAR